MFKLFFLNLTNVCSQEITLPLLELGKEYPRLNKLTVRIYHKLFVRR